MSAYLKEAENHNGNNTDFLQSALLYTGLMFANSMMATFVDGQFDLYCEMVSINMRSALICAAYQKILRIPDIDNSGQVMTLITGMFSGFFPNHNQYHRFNVDTVDIRKIVWIMRGGLLLFLLPFELFGTLIYLYLVLVCFHCVCSPLNPYTIN